MRLLNTTTLEIHEFFGSQIPFYATLSHRWGDGEVTFQDLKSEGRVDMAGWKKIAGCCSQARKDGWKYAVCVIYERRLLGQKLTVYSGSIPAALISRAVLSSRKPSIVCLSGIRTHKYAMLICLTFRILSTTMSERALHFVIVHGGR
jgi:hypothetical protein